MQTHIAYLMTDVRARSSGIRVLEPPADTKHAVRGNLYAVIEVAGHSPEQVQAVEQALSIIQRTYYSVKGTQTFVLMESLRGARDLLQGAVPQDHNSRTLLPLPGILLFSLTGNRLTAVGSGPVVALITTGSNVDVYPNYTPGVERPANLPPEIYRQELTAGGAFLLAGQRCLQHFTLRELASIVAYITEDNLADVALALRTQAEPDLLTGLIAVIGPDDEVEAPPVARPQSALTPPRRRGGLPAALSASPPVRNVNRTEPIRSTAYSVDDEPAAALHTQATAERQPMQPFPANARQPESLGQRAQTIARQWGAMIGGLLGSRAAPQASQIPGQPPTATAELADAQERLVPHQETLHQETLLKHHDHNEQAPLDDASFEESSHVARYDMSDIDAARGAQGPVAATEAIAHSWDDEGADGVDHEAAPARSQRQRSPVVPWQSPAAPKRATGKRARIFALVALSILLLTVAIVASVSWVTGRNNVAAAERTLDMAQASYISARDALDVDDKATARLKLSEAQALIAEATSLVGTRLERADNLSILIEQELAGLLQIRPLQALAVPLVQFPPEAQPQRVVVSDQDIYILDTGRQLVQRYEMDPTNNLVMNPEGETVVAQGDNIDGATVGRLVDVTWMPPVSGVDDKAYLLVLDGANNIFRYEHRVEGASRIELGGRELLKTPAEIAVYADRLYLADTGVNKIYRYGRGDFVNPPEEWFGPQTLANLGGVRSMAIDGDIWLLYDQGLLLRYRTGDQLQFSLDNSLGQLQGPVDLAVGNASNSRIYIADSAEDRILVYNKDGGYEHQLRAPEGDVLRNLRGIAVDDVAGSMYILTQSFLFNHPLPN